MLLSVGDLSQASLKELRVSLEEPVPHVVGDCDVLLSFLGLPRVLLGDLLQIRRAVVFTKELLYSFVCPSFFQGLL